MVEPFGAYCGENARQYKHRGYSPSPRPAAGYLRGAELDAAVQWVNLSGGDCGENARWNRPRGYSPSPRPAAGYLRGAELDAAVQWVNLSGGDCGENARWNRPRGYSPSPRPAAGYLRGAELDAAVQWVNLSGGIVVRMRGGTGLGGIPHPLRPRRVTFAVRNWMLRCNGWTFQGGLW